MQAKPLKQAPPRHPRIERVEAEELNAEESLLWAVSYSDLLMVLMSFFIIFFSIDEEKRVDLMQEIALSINPNLAAPATAGSGSGSEQTLAAKTPPVDGYAATVQSVFSKDPAAVTEVKDGAIHVHFDKEAFATREYKLSIKLRDDIEKLARTIKPFADQINITFVGHADSARLAAREDGIITNNHVLSALRANEAMTYAAILGLPKDSLFLQASASNTINARTISVRIERKR